MDVGERIKNRRKQLGLSAEQIAAELGVSPATVYRYESNEIMNMRIDKLEPIAKALHTSPAYLMGWSEETSSAAEDTNLVTIHYAGPVAAHFNATPDDAYEQRTIPAEWIGGADLKISFWPRSAATVCTLSSRTAMKSCACDAATWAFPAGSALCCWAAMRPLSSVSNISQARIGLISFPSTQNSSRGVSKV